MAAKKAKAGGGRTQLHTHRLVKVKEGYELERLRFLCGCRRWWFPVVRAHV